MSTSPQTSSSAQQEHSSHPLHKTYQSADALDEVVSTTAVGKWIALSVVLVAFAAGLVWAFFGTVPQQTEQYGITSDPSQVREVAAPQAGTVSFAVSDGDQVKEGDTLAEVTSFDGSNTTKVSAPLAGTVSNLSSESGTGVDAGSKLMTVTGAVTDAANLSFFLFTSQEVAALYNDPESITISWTTSAGESQELPGKVTFVAASPTNPDAIAVLAGGEDRLELLTRGEDLPLHQVTVVVADDADVSATDLPAVGQIVTVLNRYSEPHPIELLFGDQE